MKFVESFLEELSKISEEAFEPNAPEEPGDDIPTEPEEEGVPIGEQLVEEGQANAESPDAVGGFAALDTRDRFTKLLGTTEGRQELRGSYDTYRGKLNDIKYQRKAFTRSLLQARRNLSGPSPTPRRDLHALLFQREPYFEAGFVR